MEHCSFRAGALEGGLAGRLAASTAMEAVEACGDLAVSVVPLLWAETPAQVARR